MAKIITDKELGKIISKAVNDPGEIDCEDAYRHFLEDLADLVANHFGGCVGNVSEPSNIMEEWTVSFSIDESVPADGGVYKDYDKGVMWLEGEEVAPTGTH